MEFGHAFLHSVMNQFRFQKQRGEDALRQLTDGQLHWSPSEESNSIAVLIQHLNGNMLSRWTDFLTTDGEKPARNRDAEFEEQYLDRTALTSLWEQGWAKTMSCIEELTPEDLLKEITLRGQPLTVLQAVQIEVSHYGYHIGQIVLMAKWIRGNEWNNLSIPKGQSLVYTKTVRRQHPGT